MKIYANVKTPAKRGLEKLEISLPSAPDTAETLIAMLVRATLLARENQPEITLLPPNALEALTRAGRIAFGSLTARQDPAPETAIQTALDAYHDGLFRIFAGDREILSGEDPRLSENDEITILRLVFLTGGVIKGGLL